MPPAVTTIILLTLSNIFMTFAWYGHLKNMKSQPWIIAGSTPKNGDEAIC